MCIRDRPDTPPSSQNRPKLIRRTLPTAVDVDVQTYRTVVSGPPTSNVGLVEQGQGLGAPSGTPLPTSFGPLVLPKGPELLLPPSRKLVWIWGRLFTLQARVL